MENKNENITSTEINNETNEKYNKKKANLEEPDDQDLIDEIKKVENQNLKIKLLSLNELNTNLIDTKQKNYRPEYLILRNKYELKYFEIYQKIIDIVVGNKPLGELMTISKGELDKYNINEEKEEEKPIEKFFTRAIRNTKFFKCNKKDGIILEYLKNIKLIPLENKVDFRVEYYFNKNPYLENELLTKTY